MIQIIQSIPIQLVKNKKALVNSHVTFILFYLLKVEFKEIVVLFNHVLVSHWFILNDASILIGSCFFFSYPEKDPPRQALKGVRELDNPDGAM